MRNNHIINILEGKPFASLSEQELQVIQEHLDTCPKCLQAYQVAKISAVLLKERAAESVSPSPFFKTRVLASLRERQAESGNRNLGSLWRSAGALVSSMVAAVAMLVVLSFVGPDPALTPQSVVSASNSYSTEDVLFNQSEASDDQTDSQTYTTLYEAEEEAVK